MRPTRIKWRAELSKCTYPCKTASAGGSDELKKKTKRTCMVEKRDRFKMTDFLIKPLLLFCSSCVTSVFHKNSMAQRNCVLCRTIREDCEICTPETAFSADELSVKLSQVISQCFAGALSFHYPPPSPLPRVPLALVYMRQGHIITCHSFSALVNCRVNLPTRSDCAN